jgi:hypothetical protein
VEKNKRMSREITKEEAVDGLLLHIQNLVHYWENVENPYGSRASGVAHSILATIDGCSGDGCGFHLIPMMTKENQDDYKENDSNYHPIPPNEVIESDIVKTYLHEDFYRKNNDKLFYVEKTNTRSKDFIWFLKHNEIDITTEVNEAGMFTQEQVKKYKDRNDYNVLDKKIIQKSLSMNVRKQDLYEIVNTTKKKRK